MSILLNCFCSRWFVFQVTCTSVVLFVSIVLCGVSLTLLSRRTQDYHNLEHGSASDSEEDTHTQSSEEQPSAVGSINTGVTPTTPPPYLNPWNHHGNLKIGILKIGILKIFLAFSLERMCPVSVCVRVCEFQIQRKLIDHCLHLSIIGVTSENSCTFLVIAIYI